MSPVEALISAFRNYADFSGRARRSEYWWFLLCVWVISFVLIVVAFVAARQLGLIVLIAWYLVIIIPSLALVVRRLHDTGRSGAWWFIAMIPFGAVVLLVFLAMDSQPGTNPWGTSVKYPQNPMYPPAAGGRYGQQPYGQTGYPREGYGRHR